MSVSIAQEVDLVNDYTSFQASYSQTGLDLSNVITSGTKFYVNPILPLRFPNDYQAYQAYLVTLQDHINTFIANLPVAPPLSA